MTVRDDLIGKIWHGHDPVDPATQSGPADFQGWNSEHTYLKDSVRQLRPQLVVEIGVWKGCSCITMAEGMRAQGIDGVVLAVDTFLGSSEHWLLPRYFAMLPFQGGFPALYQTFLSNVISRQVQDYVLPLPLDSASAAAVVAGHGLQVDVLHIDAGHDFASVTADLGRWWPLLRRGGVLIGDDYFEDGGKWPDVRDAFRAFFGTHDIQNKSGKCWIMKDEMTK